MKFKLKITGLDCPNCAAKLAGIIESKDGITSAKINFLTEKLTVESELDKAELIPLLQKTAKAFESGVEVSE